jgi:Putative antitoxin of bacterial toxin-antitoxin system, YdaS/YdaT
MFISLHPRSGIMVAKPTPQRELAARGLVALDHAISLAGNLSRFAVAIGVPQQTVYHWRRTLFIVPLEYVPRIVAFARDVRVSPYTLRPDYAEGWALLAQQLAACSVMHSVWDIVEPEAEAVPA